MFEQKIFLRAYDGVKIPAIYSCKDEFIKPNRAILLLHGLSSNKIGYLNFYDGLALNFSKANIATLRIDFRGHGESELQPKDFTISSQITDGIVALKWLVEKGFDKVDLFGSSFSAFPCIMISNLFSNLINRIFLLAPVLDYYRTFINHTTPWGREVFSNLLERVLYRGEYIYISDEFYIHPQLVSEIASINIENFIRNLTHEIFLMHGDNDGMISYDISKEISEKNKNINFYSFSNMEHGFTDKGDEDGSSPKTIENYNRIIQIVTS